MGTNELESVFSTRRQINELLEMEPPYPSKLEEKRFREIARLYLELSDRPNELLQDPEDIREIYDRIMSGEELGDDAPDGMLFRKGAVDVIGPGGKVMHSGLEPESRIISAMSKMIALASSAEMPGIYRALVSHFLFEYAHPFYDGNGRTGRYLLALYLAQSLSTLTALTLSREIAENRKPYYRAFQEAELPMNHGELTPFVITMVEYIDRAQCRIIDDLEAKHGRFCAMSERFDQVSQEMDLSKREQDVLFGLAQQALFGAFSDVPVAELSRFLNLGAQMTRKHVKTLQEKGLVDMVSRRPLRFAISDEAKMRLEMDE